MKRTTALCYMLLVVFAILLNGCGKQLVTSKIEKSIAARLPEVIGPADNYKVEVSGHTKDMLQGEIREIRIYGKNVEVAPILKADELFVVLSDVQADTNTQTIKHVGSANFEAVVREPALNSYLRVAHPDLNELKVTLKKGRMLVHVRPSVIGISFGVNLEGDLFVVKPSTVNYKVDRLALAGLKMPGMVADYIEGKINPVQDLSDNALKINLDSALIEQGAIRMKGTADVRASLAGK